MSSSGASGSSSGSSVFGGSGAVEVEVSTWAEVERESELLSSGETKSSSSSTYTDIEQKFASNRDLPQIFVRSESGRRLRVSDCEGQYCSRTESHLRQTPVPTQQPDETRKFPTLKIEIKKNMH